MEHAMESARRLAALELARNAPRKKTPSLRKSINEHCKSCTYDPHSGMGTWRQQVEACTVTKCNLWPVRPVSKGNKEEA